MRNDHLLLVFIQGLFEWCDAYYSIAMFLSIIMLSGSHVLEIWLLLVSKEHATYYGTFIKVATVMTHYSEYSEMIFSDTLQLQVVSTRSKWPFFIVYTDIKCVSKLGLTPEHNSEIIHIDWLWRVDSVSPWSFSNKCFPSTWAMRFVG